MKKMYLSVVEKLSKGKDLPLLIMRLFIAYGFYGPAMMKLKNIDNIVSYFDSLGIPFPAINAYMAAATETTGVVLLTLGLGVRIISLPLIITMIVAIFTVHIGNGFPAAKEGVEIPLYFMIMLFTLMVYGGGKISIDNFLEKK